MHGTIVMLMAMSGLGCHHKSCDVVFAPSCYSGCYSSSYETVVEPSCYSGCYSGGYSGCYSGGYSSCYSDWGCYGGGCYGGGCYSGRKHGGLLSKLFGGGCGLFGKHRSRGCYDDMAYVDTGCYSSCYSGSYSPAVYGSSMPIYETPITSSQSLGVPSKGGYVGSSQSMTPAPAVRSPEAPATPALATPPSTRPAAPSAAAEETSTPTPPPPSPVPPTGGAVKPKI